LITDLRKYCLTFTMYADRTNRGDIQLLSLEILDRY
jgi:hypothetical protein